MHGRWNIPRYIQQGDNGPWYGTYLWGVQVTLRGLIKHHQTGKEISRRSEDDDEIHNSMFLLET
jgi:hypothetical protein